MAGRKKQTSSRRVKILGILKKVIREIPTVIWGAFAVIGIFIFGFVSGYALNEPAYESLRQEDNAKYMDVIDSYQKLAEYVYLQNQDMDIITNVTSWDSNPQEVYEAIQSYKQKRDEILFQYGKIFERRERASLPDDPYIKTE